MSDEANPVQITIPRWVDDMIEAHGALADEADAMQLTIALAHENVRRGGGPFGALVCADGAVLAGGVNRVLDTGQSIAHAEIVAIMRGQQTLRSAPRATGPLSLFASTEPCCQCFGALIWSGITRLICGASTADAEAIGFDEGPKPDGWPAVLQARGVSVALGVEAEAARRVLEDYARRGGAIYGLRSPAITSS